MPTKTGLGTMFMVYTKNRCSARNRVKDFSTVVNKTKYVLSEKKLCDIMPKISDRRQN